MYARALVLLIWALPAVAAAQPGPNRETEPFEGMWVGRTAQFDRVILQVQLTMGGPMEVRWMVLPSGSGTMMAGRCTEVVVLPDRWRCRQQREGAALPLPGSVRAVLHGPEHMELWWERRQVHFVRVAAGVDWYATPRSRAARSAPPARRSRTQSDRRPPHGRP